jgi:hypothetical protein
MNAATNRLAGRSYNTCGASTCSSRPSRITATRSPIVIASVWSCVTYSVVVPSSWCSRAMYARISTRSLASKLLKGSSIRNAAGWRTIARPNATRWRWPPLS